MFVVPDKLEKHPLFLNDYTYDKSKFILSFEQRFSSGKPQIEMINQTDNWSFSIPHESSGPCYTYDPPFNSDPGYINSMYLTLNMEKWEPDLDFFIHEKGKFFYQDAWTMDTTRVDLTKLQNVSTGHPRISGNLKQSILC
jgi:hypothetical protein